MDSRAHPGSNVTGVYERVLDLMWPDAFFAIPPNGL
jgi:hypothetical protein